ncbi:MAG: Mur ligase domain-containing protein, partial [Armatimonadota bacterium]|nr:Mur ligase domain-containing protein [Armatimonadota bacterium]
MSTTQPTANRARFTLREVVAVTGGEIIHLAPPANDALEIVGVSTDTRTLGEGSLFVALRGEKFDGHAFLAQAAQAGAAAAMVEEVPTTEPPLTPLILVKNTVEALGALAAAHRQR